MTDVPDLVRVALIAPIGNSDHSPLSAVISMAEAVLNLCVSRKGFLKHRVNFNTVCGAIQDLPWHNIWSADNPVELLNEHLLLLVGHNVPTKVIRVRKKNKPRFDDLCRSGDDFGLKLEAIFCGSMNSRRLIGCCCHPSLDLPPLPLGRVRSGISC